MATNSHTSAQTQPTDDRRVVLLYILTCVPVFLWQKQTSVLKGATEFPSDAIKPDEHADALTKI